METFLYSSVTKDGYKIAVGGLCPNNMGTECAESYKAFETIKFGREKSEFFIDFMLSKYIREFSILQVKCVCASIKVSDNGPRCGGIAGNPFQENESADGALEKNKDNIYTVAVPGRMGIVFESDYNTAKEIHKYFLDLNYLPIKEAIICAVLFMEQKKVTFVFASDGSGEGSFGAVYTSGQKWCYLQ
ncbi:MAG: hypothetical protein WBJ13_00380 [Sedimentibacter sp.]